MLLTPSVDERPLILLVDDSVENLQVLNALLKDQYRLKVAKSGAKAIELANTAPMPDLILLDVVMPEMDGFEVCERLKSDPQTKHIPIIFLTALNEVADETAGLQKGGADFISKPISPDIVKARINVHLALQAERKKADALLRVLLPENVITQLINKGGYTPEVYKNASVLFLDFIGFTAISNQLAPEFLIAELTDIFSSFDEISQQHGVMRIKTIGDAYMAASGLHLQTENHAASLVDAGLSFIDFIKRRNATSKQQWHCRVGVHSGSVIAGVIGKTRFLYDIMGMDVNIAARVESQGKSMEVTITETTRKLLDDRYIAEDQGLATLKGAGEMRLYTLKR